MENMMWFGNRNYMQWIKCPESGATYGSQGSSQSAAFRNGGAFRRNSLSSAKTYQLSWSITKRDNIRAITDYYEGVYGPGAVFWSDPFNMDKNVLTQTFATPSLGGYDGPTLDGKEARPQLTPTSANSYGYPTQSATYLTGSDSTEFFKHYVPIPPDHTAWVGAHGDPGSQGGIMVQPTVGAAAVGAPTRAAILPVNTDQRFSNSFPATGTRSGVELSLEAGTSVKNLAPNPSYEAGGGGSVEVDRNRILDPLPTGVSAFTVTNSTVAISGGGATMTSTLTTTGASTVRLNINANAVRPAVTPATQVELSVDVASAQSVDGALAILFYDAANAYITGSIVSGSAFTNTATFQRRTLVATVPAGAATAAFYLGNGGSISTGNTMTFRNLKFGAPGRPFFYPGASPDPDLVASWVGTAAASQSILTGVRPGNVVAAASGLTLNAYRTQSSPDRGSYSARWVITTSASVAIPISDVSPTPGQVYTIMFRARSNSRTLVGTPRVGGITDSARNVTMTQGVWVDFSATITSGSGGSLAVQTGLLINGVQGQTTGDTIDIDSVVLVQGTYTGGYFDGSSAGAEWDGAPNASTSTLSSRTTTLAGIMVQVLPNGITPEAGGFISGQGHAGCNWDNGPSKEAYSAAMDYVGMSASFIETEPWR